MTQRLTLPEIDRLVAARVMGWRPYVAEGTFLGSDGAIKNTHSSARGETAFHPTADIAHAWRVVERMRAMRGEWGCPSWRNWRNWWIGFGAKDNGAQELWHLGSSEAALHISLAALRVVGVEVEVADG